MTSQHVSIVTVVYNPEQLLCRRQTTAANRHSRFKELSETLDLTVPTLGSSSDSEPNLFLETTADLSGPIIPGQFRLTASPVISEEAFVRAILEPSPFRIHNSFLTSLTISETSTPAVTQPPILQEKPDNMPSRTNMPTPLSPSAPKWDRQSKMLRNFLGIIDIANQWSSFEEYKAGSWTLFLEKLKIEYPELTSKEQSTMEQLRKLCREYQNISMLEEERLSHPCHTLYISLICYTSLTASGM